MKKWLKWTLGILVILILGLFIYFKYSTAQTKRFSPEDTVSYSWNDLSVKVFYNRPYKKGRVIFGDLVPFGETWRTGANEATTFDTETDLIIDGKTLPAGHYTLWTVPGPEEWEVVWNSEDYPWGLGWDGETMREPEHDVLIARVPVQHTDEVTEQFTISFKENHMFLDWDQTRIEVELEVKG